MRGAYIRNLVRQLLVESSDVAKADDFTIVKKAIKNAYADGRSVMDRTG